MTASKSSLIQREDAGSPAGDVSRRSILERAKQRTAGKVVPGPMQNVPRFDAVQEADRGGMRPAVFNEQAPVLSKATEQGLQALMAASATSTASSEPPQEIIESPRDPEALAELLRCDVRVARRIYELLNPDKNPDQLELDRTRKVIEKRLGTLDIGEFLMNGVLSQRVTIIPASDTSRSGLEVVFQTVTDGVEAHVDRLLSDEAARIRHVRLGDGSDKVVDAEMNQREFTRRANELAIAVHVRSYMGNAWPALTLPNGEVDPAAVAKRLAQVRQIPSMLMVLVLQNLSWFLERVQETLNVAVLGNG